MNERLSPDFFSKDVLEIAPALLGKKLIREYPDGKKSQFIISETEAYRGEEDLACHASKGRTTRTEIMYGQGGFVYVYLIYGMYWMLNIVTGANGVPQASLIRGLKGLDGPGKITRHLGIDKSFYGENLTTSKRLYICEGLKNITFKTGIRIGVDYAGEIWKNKPWRYILDL
jgi:DNA-3-methyladenine glycosylase